MNLRCIYAKESQSTDNNLHQRCLSMYHELHVFTDVAVNDDLQLRLETFRLAGKYQLFDWHIMGNKLCWKSPFDGFQLAAKKWIRRSLQNGID